MFNRLLSNSMPADVLFLILNFLTTEDKVRFSSTCKKATKLVDAYPWTEQLLKQFGIVICNKENVKLSIKALCQFEKLFNHKKICEKTVADLMASLNILMENGELWSGFYLAFLLCDKHVKKSSHDIFNMGKIHSYLKKSVEYYDENEKNLRNPFKFGFSQCLLAFNNRAIKSFEKNITIASLEKYFNNLNIQFSDDDSKDCFEKIKNIFVSFIRQIHGEEFGNIADFIMDLKLWDDEDSLDHLMKSFVQTILQERILPLIQETYSTTMSFFEVAFKTYFQNEKSTPEYNSLRALFLECYLKCSRLLLPVDMEDGKIRVDLNGKTDLVWLDINAVTDVLNICKSLLGERVALAERLQAACFAYGNEQLDCMLTLLQEIKAITKEYFYHEQFIKQICVALFLINDMALLDSKANQALIGEAIENNFLNHSEDVQPNDDREEGCLVM